MATCIRLWGFPGAEREKVITRSAGDGLSIGEILGALGVSAEQYSLIIVGGHRAVADRIPEDGEVVDVYPFLGGG